MKMRKGFAYNLRSISRQVKQYGCYPKEISCPQDAEWIGYYTLLELKNRGKVSAEVFEEQKEEVKKNCHRIYMKTKIKFDDYDNAEKSLEIHLIGDTFKFLIRKGVVKMPVKDRFTLKEKK